MANQEGLNLHRMDDLAVSQSESKVPEGVDVAPTDLEDQLDTVLPVVSMDMKIADVKQYYTKREPGAVVDIKDIIIHVRKEYPNPRQRVIVKCDSALPAKDLEEVLIYVQGVNEYQANSIQGLGYFCYCPIEVTSEMMKQDGYGIQQFVDEFCSVNNINNCEILIYGDSSDSILEVWDFIQTSGTLNHTILFPQDVVHRLKLLTNGLDLSPYAREMSQARDRNALNVSFINGILNRIGDEIAAGKTALQDFEDTRSVYAKWLTLTLTQRHNLVPVYLGSYISEYVDMEAAYPLTRLSMYERFKFVERLPAKVGYIGKYRGFSCIFSIAKKIYPIPAVAFDLTSQLVITEGLDQFAYDTLRVADWREWFKDSPTYYVEKQVKTSTALKAGMTDREVDEKLRAIFLKMTEAMDGTVYMSVRNSVLASHRGKLYVLYYDQPLGIAGAMISEHFGTEPMVLSEEHFSQLIDVRVIVAKNKSNEMSTTAARSSQFTELMTTLPQTFTTAIPLDVLMNCVLVGQGADELSYYDRRLRCDKNVLPIITHADSEMHQQHTVFDYINVLDMGADPVAGPIISSFGSINSDSGYLTKIPVSIESFRGWKLL